MPFFRREIIRIALRLVPDCLQMVFTHAYSSAAFLILDGTMWSLNMHFDTSFFAVAACWLNYLDIAVMDFSDCIWNFVNYRTGEQRILHRLSTPHLTCPLKQAHWQQVYSANLSSAATRLHIWLQHGSFILRNIIFDAHPYHRTCWIRQSQCIDLSLSSIDGWDRPVRWQSATGLFVLRCAARALSVSSASIRSRCWLCRWGIFSSTVKKNILFGKKTMLNSFDASFEQWQWKQWVLVTHQIQFLEDAMKIIVLENVGRERVPLIWMTECCVQGEMGESGKYQEL